MQEIWRGAGTEVKALEPISKMALKAKSCGFRRKAAAAGAMRIRDTQSPEKAALQKSADCSPNAFLRWVLHADDNRTGFAHPKNLYQSQPTKGARSIAEGSFDLAAVCGMVYLVCSRGAAGDN